MNSIVAPNVKRIIKQKCLKQSAVAARAGYTPNQFAHDEGPKDYQRYRHYEDRDSFGGRCQ